MYTYEAIIIPIRTYDFEKKRKGVLQLNDTIIQIERQGINKSLFSVEIQKYHTGQNKYLGLVPIGKDTLPFQVSFFVK